MRACEIRKAFEGSHQGAPIGTIYDANEFGHITVARRPGDERLFRAYLNEVSAEDRPESESVLVNAYLPSHEQRARNLARWALRSWPDLTPDEILGVCLLAATMLRAVTAKAPEGS